MSIDYNECFTIKHKNEHMVWHRIKTGARKGAQPICERWQDFRNFFEDMGPKPDTTCRLVMIDETLGFVPGNCVWKPSKASPMIIDGQSYTIGQIATLWGVSVGAARNRLYNSDPERIKRQYTPLRPGRKVMDYQDIECTCSREEDNPFKHHSKCKRYQVAWHRKKRNTPE